MQNQDISLDSATPLSFLSSLSKHFPHQFPSLHSDIDLKSDSITNILEKLIENLPSPEPSRTLDLMQRSCEMQEQKIYSKLCQYRQFDVYEEMNKVSSELNNLRNMGPEDLNKKFYDTIERMKRFEEKATGQMEIEEIEFHVKLEANNDETESNSKFNYQNMLQSSNDSLIERDENEDPIDHLDKKDLFIKVEDLCFTNLLMTRKPKKFAIDFNNIHNFLDENENANGSPYHQYHNELNILKEIDLNEGISNNRLLYE